MANDWNEAEPKELDETPIWVWEEKKDLIGLLVGKKKDVGPNESMLYEVESGGVNYAVWGSGVLDDRFEEIEIGEEIRVNFKGMVKSKSGGRSYRDFVVHHRWPDATGNNPIDSDMKEVADSFD